MCDAARPGSLTDAERLQSLLPQAVISIDVSAGDVRVMVRRECIVDVVRLLHDDPELQYTFFCECLGVDYLDMHTGASIQGKGHRYEVVYNLCSLVDPATGALRNRRLFLKVPVPATDPEVPSVTSVFGGAGFPEREVYDLMGIRFSGHPDLRRILMSDDWSGHPLRKDYPLGGERVQFPGGTTGPSVGESVVQHAGESFTGRTASALGDVE
jgi:NADH-quinone oxidoreductase subunit C